MEEIFKIIPGFENYEVSNFGRVRTLSRMIRFTHAVTKKEHFRQTTHRFLKDHFNKFTGYKFYQLYKDKKMYNRPSHTLVALAFLEKGIGHDTVNHKDGNKLNNIVDNLEWCTNRYNHEHATKNGLVAHGERVGTSKLNNRCVLAIKSLLNEGFTHLQISKWFNVSRASISLINKNKTWRRVSGLNIE